MIKMETWYIVKQANGQCTIVDSLPSTPLPADTDVWGPYAAQGDAIARRVGLIRAGKCQPA